MDHRAFLPFAQSLQTLATSYILEFHGHGQTPPPPASWGTAEYAAATAKCLNTVPKAEKRIWVGHSFGCRVGLQLGAHYKGLFHGMVLIAAAGLKRKRKWYQRTNHWLRVKLFKTLKIFVPEGPARDALRARFGSPDYKNTRGTMRTSFVRIVNEDLSAEAEATTCPTLIICGSLDLETPPELSQRLHQKIKNSELCILDSYDHYTILTTAKHQVLSRIKKFMDTTWTS
jgi:pimeloyl-ACP methyl ester carboxylesterase